MRYTQEELGRIERVAIALFTGRRLDNVDETTVRVLAGESILHGVEFAQEWHRRIEHDEDPAEVQA